MAKQNVSIVIVPGSFGTPPLYEPLLNVLRGQGYDARTIELPSANDGSVFPAPTADDDAAHIRRAVTSLLDDTISPRNVVLAVHSYAGIPGSSAVQGLSRADRAAHGKDTAVVGMVYIAAFVLPLGQGSRAFMNAAGCMPEGPIRDGIPGGYLPAIDPVMASWVFDDIEGEDEQAKWLPMMARQSSDSYDGVVRYEAWKEIASIQIIPEKDVVIPTQLQEKMHEEAQAAGGIVTRVFAKAAGHTLVINRSELVAREIVKLTEAC